MFIKLRWEGMPACVAVIRGISINISAGGYICLACRGANRDCPSLNSQTNEAADAVEMLKLDIDCECN